MAQPDLPTLEMVTFGAREFTSVINKGIYKFELASSSIYPDITEFEYDDDHNLEVVRQLGLVAPFSFKPPASQPARKIQAFLLIRNVLPLQGVNLAEPISPIEARP
ncbi:hypothetical protein [Desulfatibacillum aliphaticivorans]|uniref:hypothetical protein n=1 Tax=Desulfatibacillum aliphaticivorans TaxID=218208 RepID=UPI00041FB6A0|nr:hypothetical protein [Desulfatibacillum aliphaticivorans]